MLVFIFRYTGIYIPAYWDLHTRIYIPGHWNQNASVLLQSTGHAQRFCTCGQITTLDADQALWYFKLKTEQYRYVLFIRQWWTPQEKGFEYVGARRRFAKICKRLGNRVRDFANNTCFSIFQKIAANKHEISLFLGGVLCFRPNNFLRISPGKEICFSALVSGTYI